MHITVQRLLHERLILYTQKDDYMSKFDLIQAAFASTQRYELLMLLVPKWTADSVDAQYLEVRVAQDVMHLDRRKLEQAYIDTKQYWLCTHYSNEATQLPRLPKGTSLIG